VTVVTVVTNRVVQPSDLFGRILFFILAISLSAISISPSSAASVPSAPEYVEAMAGTNQVAVIWGAPSPSAGESLNYTARVWTVPPPTFTPVFASCSTTGLGCVIGGLVTGTSYYVDVIASNSFGSSGPSTMRPVSPGNAGSPPTNVTASSESPGRITVKWTPSTAFGTGQFAWYTAEAITGSEISAGAYTSFCTADPASATTCLMTGLKVGSTYYVQVRTVTSLGSSYPSTPRYKVFVGTTASASPTVKPSSSTSTRTLTAPQSVKVVALSKAVRVTWKAPSVTAGKKITYYRVGIYNKAGVLRSFCRTKATIYSCTLAKLKPKVMIYIGVVALYMGVESPRSKLIAVIPKA
jgi:hypothetical protein